VVRARTQTRENSVFMVAIEVVLKNTDTAEKLQGKSPARAFHEGVKCPG
jgi:hypothetical protein